MASGTGSTEDRSYTERLSRLGGARWKQVLDVQAPYRWNLRRHLGGRTVLDVGCGIGRNLQHLDPSSVGVDHNPESVTVCRGLGLRAITTDEMESSPEMVPGRFDGLLAAHLLEHLPEGAAAEMLRPYIRFLAPGARLVFICPQQRGFRSDATHTVYFDDALLARTMREIGAEVVDQASFPFPRVAGRWFTYNEFVTVGRLTDPR